jgi:leucyl aminopeptidase
MQIKVFLTSKIPKKITAYNFKAKYGSCFLLDKELYIGTKLKSIKTVDPYYKVDYFLLGAKIGNSLKNYDIATVDISSSEKKLNQKEVLDLKLGILQSYWKFDKYQAKKIKELPKITISKDIAESIEDENKLKSLNLALNSARFLVEETPQNLHPDTIGEIIKKELREYKNLEIKTYDEKWLEENCFECVLAVGKGSPHKPKLIHTKISIPSTKNLKIALVGKGLTYDTGGLDIKVGGFMKTMKTDMGGSATMFGVIKTLAEMYKNENGKSDNYLEIHWFSAFCENAVSGDSYKSDDILTSFSGQTVEIFNTDAEGRLTLADVLSYATTFNPDYIVDAATLTGACVYSNSDYYTGMMGNDEKLIKDLNNAFLTNNERVVNNHFPEILRQYVAGTNSDLMNTSTLSQAGHITAGLFLSHFIDQSNFRPEVLEKLKITKPKTYSWVHLDIAGSAYNKKHNSLDFEGATGHGVRSLVDWILNLTS